MIVTITEKPLVPLTVTKRSGETAGFDRIKIARALAAALDEVGAACDRQYVDYLTETVVNTVAAKARGEVPSVETVQDACEFVLFGAGQFEAAKHYILYREEHARQRNDRPIPDAVKAAFADADQYFPTQIQKFQFFDKYSRFDYGLGRRETWVETVDRATDFLHEIGGYHLPADQMERVHKAILEMRAMPSMRLLAMAGPAARRNNIAIYNCSYLPVDDLRSFTEALYISMSGCGVGFSVESRYVDKLPRVHLPRGSSPQVIVFEDSAEGWVEGVLKCLELWVDGGDAIPDLRNIRPAGAVLRTKGGRASGPEPLMNMLNFARARILARAGGVLRPIDAHDIMCAVGNAAVQGGVRRTAMISLFDFDDNEMRHAKDPGFDRDNSQRWNANNSIVTPERGLTQLEFADTFLDMVRSGNGEPGIFNRQVAEALLPDRRVNLNWNTEWGTNPCGEIVLRPYELCNLSIAVARAGDTEEDLLEKVTVAAIIGTIQSNAIDFPILRPEWSQNCQEERLLGVDITGQLDCPRVQDPYVKQKLLKQALVTNQMIADMLGINRSAAITTVKPSGNSAQLLNCSSGLHARWAPYYIRNVRVSATSPLFKVLRDAQVPMDPENGQTVDDATTWVVHFPVKSPEGAVTRNDRGAIDQCEYWLENKVWWTEHNPSVTITYRPDEVLALTMWVWEHRDMIGGMAFLPAFDAQYDQLPYEEITAKRYQELAAAFPVIDFSKVYQYESDDMTTAAQELACVAGVCDL